MACLNCRRRKVQRNSWPTKYRIPLPLLFTGLPNLAIISLPWDSLFQSSSVFPQGSATSDAYPPPRRAPNSSPLPRPLIAAPIQGDRRRDPPSVASIFDLFVLTPASLPQQPADPFIPWPVPHSQPCSLKTTITISTTVVGPVKERAKVRELRITIAPEIRKGILVTLSLRPDALYQWYRGTTLELPRSVLQALYDTDKEDDWWRIVFEAYVAAKCCGNCGGFLKIVGRSKKEEGKYRSQTHKAQTGPTSAGGDTCKEQRWEGAGVVDRACNLCTPKYRSGIKSRRSSATRNEGGGLEVPVRRSSGEIEIATVAYAMIQGLDAGVGRPDIEYLSQDSGN
ncbi:hypothetical protein FB45DRAFT_860014 [Roridomyces roridus]|uniref:Uncharacterized protein n=1 Tax=Roridomyces roridus TaxID=1738132 RepID=A0AAD7CE29_9AGAR|nr:hypothetical protein FB45DRAFT_860014 [Roridomyces roridus]